MCCSCQGILSQKQQCPLYEAAVCASLHACPPAWELLTSCCSHIPAGSPSISVVVDVVRAALCGQLCRWRAHASSKPAGAFKVQLRCSTMAIAALCSLHALTDDIARLVCAMLPELTPQRVADALFACLLPPEAMVTTLCALARTHLSTHASVMTAVYALK